MQLLIVASDMASEQALGGVLHAQGHRHHVRRDTAEAWEALCERRYDVVILDVHKSAHVEFVHLLRSRRARRGPDPATPVVVMSTRADAHARVLALNAGADLSLEKPFHPEELLALAHAAARLRGTADAGVTAAGSLPT